MMVYRIMIRIRTMYSISSPPPERRGKKASPLQMKGDHRQPYGNTCQYYITLLLPAQSTTQLLVYALPEPRDPQDLPAFFDASHRPLAAAEKQLKQRKPLLPGRLSY